MGCDWFFPYVVFGYKIKTSSYSRTYNSLIKSFDFPDPFDIYGLLEDFPSTVYHHSGEMKDSAILVLGFSPQPNKTLFETTEKLKEFISVSPILKELVDIENPGFYVGINWTDYIDPEDVSDSESESDEEEEEDEEDDEDNSDDEEEEEEDDENGK